MQRYGQNFEFEVGVEMDEFTPEERSFFERNLACPFCGSDKIKEGPSGGLSQNILCMGTYQDGNDVVPCGAKVNHTPLGVELIQRGQMDPKDYACRIGKPLPLSKPKFTKNDILAEFGLAKKKKWWTPWRQA